MQLLGNPVAFMTHLTVQQKKLFSQCFLINSLVFIYHFNKTNKINRSSGAVETAKRGLFRLDGKTVPPFT